MLQLEGAEGGSLHGPWGADIDRRGAARSGASADLLGRAGGVVSRGEVRGDSGEERWAQNIGKDSRRGRRCCVRWGSGRGGQRRLAAREKRRAAEKRTGAGAE